MECRVERATLLGENRELAFTQNGGRLTIKGLPTRPPDPLCPVIRFDCDGPPVMYLCGGMRTPKAAHPHYDPRM